MKFLAFLLALIALPLDARAAEFIQAQLISAYKGTGNLKTIDMALDLDLKDQWYTYWRMPGDSGLAPRFDWTGSENVQDITLSWPTPSRFALEELQSFGYKDEVIFPLIVTPKEPGKDIVLKLVINVMVCHDICIPQEITMMRIFGAGASEKSEHYAVIEKAKKALPGKENSADISIGAAVLAKNAVTVTATSRKGFDEGKTDLIIETPNAILTGRPQILPQRNAATDVVLKINGPDGVDLTKELFGKSVTILLINGADVLEKTVSF